MQRQDLRASLVIATVWLFGVTVYAIFAGNAPAASDRSIYNAFEPVSTAQKIFAKENAPKHNKVPVHWAHQRWGAV